MENFDDKLAARTRGSLMWGIALSIGLVIGVPMIVLGFVFKGGFIAMAVLGIVCTVAGFYGAPLVWVHYGELKYYTRVKRHIVGEKIRSVRMLSELHGKKDKIMINDVKTMVQKGYLPGFIVLDDEKIIDKAAMKNQDYEVLEAERAGELNLVHCPFCNAKFALILDVGECPYCKSRITKEMLQSKVKAYNKEDNPEEDAPPAEKTKTK